MNEEKKVCVIPKIKKIDWNEELKKCKESHAYFYNNYFIINGERPKIKLRDEDFDFKFKFHKRRSGPSIKNLDLILRYPLTPKDVFPCLTEKK